MRGGEERGRIGRNLAQGGQCAAKATAPHHPAHLLLLLLVVAPLKQVVVHVLARLLVASCDDTEQVLRWRKEHGWVRRRVGSVCCLQLCRGG